MAVFQPKINENEMIRADINAHDKIWDQHAHPHEREDQLTKAYTDAEGDFFNNVESATR